ncbi:hypothetical protein G774_02854 [Escherichia coli HVH 113 (4-7535473)]|nr:hypothetical protein G774_02854 [Escherichia coli HVH 113 (4-7535473)]
MAVTVAHPVTASDSSETQCRWVVDAAVDSRTPSHLSLQGVRKSIEAETTDFNSVFDATAAVLARASISAPDFIWPQLP